MLRQRIAYRPPVSFVRRIAVCHHVDRERPVDQSNANAINFRQRRSFAVDRRSADAAEHPLLVGRRLECRKQLGVLDQLKRLGGNPRIGRKGRALSLAALLAMASLNRRKRRVDAKL
jgi:hypothetical protein